jgi:hypothetical protein
MADLLKINEAFFNEAVSVIVKERQRVGDSVVAKDIDSVVRAYVQLGLEKKIPDWAWNVGEENKDAIIKAVMEKTRQMYGFTPAYAKVYTNLDIIETQAAYGMISMMIAKPRAAQEAWEISEEASHSSSKDGPADTSINAAISRVFGEIGKGVESALKGLGLSLGDIWIIGIAIIIVTMTLRGRK